jgi:hypothetical protein
VARVRKASTTPANEGGDRAADRDLEEALDELHAASPKGFVAARADLVRRLREAGDPRASEVAGLRRPAVSAWLVNALVRRSPEAIAALFEAGDRLRAAQVDVLGGASPARLQSATNDVRKTIAAALRIAGEVRGAPLTADLERRLATTLRAAAVDPSIREEIARRRLHADPTDEPAPLSSLEASTRAVAPKALRTTPGRAAQARRTETETRKRVDARRRREAEEREREAARAARIARADAEVTGARETVLDAQREVRRARARLASAEKAEAAASEILARAEEQRAKIRGER